MTDKKWKILLVEDDIELGQLIQEYLNAYEFDVSIEENGIIAKNKIIQEQPDLVILDLMLPGKDGISVCREVRPLFENSIVMLTASNESIDHILGLEIGADDYLKKPIEPRVLLAHLRAQLRRQSKVVSASGSSNLKCGNIELVQSDRLVRVDKEVLELLDHEYDLLCLLMTQVGVVITRDDIFQELKGIEYDGMNRFCDILVSQLRTKLAIDGISDNHIKTVRNKGYIFVENF